MTTAEALMELVPNAASRRSGPPPMTSTAENDEEKEKAMAATYAAYTKRAKMNAEKAKAQQLSRQIKTRLQFARLKVDYGWTRQSLNEVENLYFHLSRTRPAPQLAVNESNAPTKEEVQDVGPSTPQTVGPTTVQASLDTHIPTSQPTQSVNTPAPVSQTQSLPSLATSPSTMPFLSSSQPSLTVIQSTSAPKRTPFVERTRTGGIVRSNPAPERLRTGGKVKATVTTSSPKKRGRPRIPDDSETSSPAHAPSPAVDGNLTYDSFWTSLGSLKTSGS